MVLGRRSAAMRVQCRTASVRLVAADRHVVAVALVGVVVPKCLVLDTAIVPERDRVGPPPEAHAKPGRLDVPIEHLEDGVALVPPEADNMRREGAVDEEAFLPGDRMRPDHGVLGARERFAGVIDAIPSAFSMAPNSVNYTMRSEWSLKPTTSSKSCERSTSPPMSRA